MTLVHRWSNQRLSSSFFQVTCLVQLVEEEQEGGAGGSRGEEQEEELNLLDCFVGNGFTYEFGCL